MKNSPTRSNNMIIFAVLLPLLVWLTGCSTMKVASMWSDQKVTIDGKNTEWNDKSYLIENGKLLMGVQNDSTFLYLMLSTNDRILSRKLMSEGLTVWFDPKGGKEKNFGIRYPLGYRSNGVNPSDEPGSDMPSGDSFRMSSLLRELEILGPGKENHQRMAIMASGGIDVTVNFAPGSLVYELKVPFVDKPAYPFSIQSAQHALIGLGLETPEVSSRADSRSGEVDAGGASGRRGGSRGGVPTGPDPERMREAQEPLKLWMNIQLASRDSMKVK
jgi:hypothetical protein